MVPITFEEAVGYFGLWLFVLGVCCSFIVGLYYLADLVEEHFKTTKKVIHWTILGTLGVLLLLWLLEGVEPLTMLPSLGAQLGYWRVVARRFPFLSVRDPTLLGAGALTVWAHLAWMHYHLTTFHHLIVVLGFFLVTVWLVPLMVVLSMAANENCLPGASSGMPPAFYAGAGASGSGGAGASGGGGGGGSGSGGQRGSKATRSLLGSIFDRVVGAGRGGKERAKEKDRSW